MKKIAIVAAAAVVAVTTAGSATAGTRHSLSPGSDNRMTFAEWYEIGEGQPQGNVQSFDGGCDCTGTNVRQWVGGDGHARKWVQYADTDPVADVMFIQYRLTADGQWHTDKVKYLAKDGDAEPFYYGVPTF